MKPVFTYVYDHRHVCLWIVLSSIVFAVVFALYGITLKAVWYPLLISGMIGIVLLVLGFIRFGKKHRELDHIFIEKGAISDITDALPSAETLEEEDYQSLIARIESVYRAEKGE